MAGAFDKETLSFSTADEQAKAAGTRTAAVDAVTQAKEQAAYTSGKSTTGQTLAKQKTTIQNLAARANEITDPTKRKAFVESSKIALGDVKLGLELQAIIDKAEFASNIAKDPNNLMNSDSIFTSSTKTGVSNSGKYYVKGKEVTQQEYVNTVGVDTGGGGGTGGGGAGSGTGGGSGNLTGGAGTSEQQIARQSAFDLLKLQFDEYGLGALVEPLRGLIQEGISPSEFAVRLRQTEPYKKRFAANAARVSSGLRALSEGEYIRLEDEYQNVMRNYGLPASYYTKGDMGRQEGFEKLIAGDVSMTELEDRIMIAQNRVINAAPEVTEALKQFYPDIKNADILAYTLDPTQGLATIKKKVLAAEIGGAAIGAGLGAAATRAEELARYGVTAESARQGYEAIGGGLERGRQLSSIYQQPDYNQAVAEQEVFNLPGQAQAGEKRKKIIGLEKATFGGQTGVSSGALSQNRAGSY
jgi:hypothetical protein